MKQLPSDEPLESGSAQIPGNSQKIEEQKHAQEELLKLSRLDEFFQQTPEAVTFLSNDGRVLRINKEFTHIFGYEPEEVIGRHIDELIVRREYSQELYPSSPRVEVETVRRRKDRRATFQFTLPAERAATAAA